MQRCGVPDQLVPAVFVPQNVRWTPWSQATPSPMRAAAVKHGVILVEGTPAPAPGCGRQPGACRTARARSPCSAPAAHTPASAPAACAALWVFALRQCPSLLRNHMPQPAQKRNGSGEHRHLQLSASCLSACRAVKREIAQQTWLSIVLLATSQLPLLPYYPLKLMACDLGKKRPG